MSIRRASLGPLVVLALLLTAACGGDDDADPPTTDESQAEGPCALLPIADVSDLFGRDAEVAPPAAEGAATTSCLWEAVDEDGEFPTRHQLQLSVYENGGELDPRSYGEGSEPIEDLGDEAFVVREGTLGTTAGYRDGDRTVILTYAIVGGEDAPRPADSADQVVDLLRAAAASSD
ncbi:MAG TPA: hypothetical protein VIL48_08905 [Acidimicrobiales bacterium]